LGKIGIEMVKIMIAISVSLLPTKYHLHPPKPHRHAFSLYKKIIIILQDIDDPKKLKMFCNLTSSTAQVKQKKQQA